jgi:hypothetical protein
VSLVVHCQRAHYDVYVGRGNGSIFGNPFTHKEGTQALWLWDRARTPSRRSGTGWSAQHTRTIEPERRQAILSAIPTLKGKVLGCWCAPLACHGDVLAELANAEPGSARPRVPNVAPGNIFSWRAQRADSAHQPHRAG